MALKYEEAARFPELPHARDFFPNGANHLGSAAQKLGEALHAYSVAREECNEFYRAFHADARKLQDLTGHSYIKGVSSSNENLLLESIDEISAAHEKLSNALSEWRWDRPSTDTPAVESRLLHGLDELRPLLHSLQQNSSRRSNVDSDSASIAFAKFDDAREGVPVSHTDDFGGQHRAARRPSGENKQPLTEALFTPFPAIPKFPSRKEWLQRTKPRGLLRWRTSDLKKLDRALGNLEDHSNLLRGLAETQTAFRTALEAQHSIGTNVLQSQLLRVWRVGASQLYPQLTTLIERVEARLEAWDRGQASNAPARELRQYIAEGKQSFRDGMQAIDETTQKINAGLVTTGIQEKSPSPLPRQRDDRPRTLKKNRPVELRTEVKETKKHKRWRTH